MPATVADLVHILELTEREPDVFVGTAPTTEKQRVFGGQVLAQALMASGHTVPDERHVHSLHAYFLRPGDPTTSIEFAVERLRDGRAFSTRRAVGSQHGRPIFAMTSSFQITEPGVEHQDPMPVVPDPESLMTLPERTRAGRPIGGSSADEWAALDIRVVEPEPGQDGLQVWLRTSGALPDDPLVHAAALAYASDLTLLGSAILPNGIAPNDPNVFLASIDHAMWFHQPVRMDRWLLHDQQSPSASGGRGLGRGRVFDLDGTLVATTVQEGLIRLLLPESATGDRTQA